MGNTETNGYKISILSVGSGALGMDYDVFHKKVGQKSQECFEILPIALNTDINTFYTRDKEMPGT